MSCCSALATFSTRFLSFLVLVAGLGALGYGFYMLDSELNGFSLFVVIFGAYTALMGMVGVTVSCMQTARKTTWIVSLIPSLSFVGAEPLIRPPPAVPLPSVHRAGGGDRVRGRAQGRPQLGRRFLRRRDVWQSEYDPLCRISAPGGGLLREPRGNGLLHPPWGHHSPVLCGTLCMGLQENTCFLRIPRRRRR